MNVRASCIRGASPGLAARAAEALVYGVALPVLPTVVASTSSTARKTAELTAVYRGGRGGGRAGLDGAQSWCAARPRRQGMSVNEGGLPIRAGVVDGL